jgi:hypothetical protein
VERDTEASAVRQQLEAMNLQAIVRANERRDLERQLASLSKTSALGGASVEDRKGARARIAAGTPQIQAALAKNAAAAEAAAGTAEELAGRLEVLRVEKQVADERERAAQASRDAATRASEEAATTVQGLTREAWVADNAAKKQSAANNDALAQKDEEIRKERQLLAASQNRAKMSVAGFIAERKAELDQQGADDKDAKRLERLDAKVKRGVKLSKRDQEFMGAAIIREAEVNAAAQGPARIAQMEVERQQMQEDALKAAQDAAETLDTIKQNIVAALTLKEG